MSLLEENRGGTFKSGIQRGLTQMTKLKLPRFPPRKARKTPTLIRFVVQWLDRFHLLSNSIPTNSPFNMKYRLKLLLLAAIDRTSISRKARDLREQQLLIPSGEATLAWLKTDSVEDIRISQQIGFQQFLESLPESFQLLQNYCKKFHDFDNNPESVDRFEDLDAQET